MDLHCEADKPPGGQTRWMESVDGAQKYKADVSVIYENDIGSYFYTL